MGKYIRKSKRKGETAVLMEVSQNNQSSLGVRTRAKTLALQRQGKLTVGDACYLELRSRRLQKPPLFGKEKEVKVKQTKSPNLNSRAKKDGTGIGGNHLEFDGMERSKRETTPCNLIRDPDNIKTPRSTTKRPNLTETSGTDSKQKRILTANDMNEFFIGSEVAQQKQFTEKYNFDPVNEKPLPGRFEWVKVDP